ncbi:MAG: hypothetical protein KatS3mg087_2093 [Patescibacteria group bacterium]|nr:MAG: hypothetical protein KatS3mg087_2093 [Patescibacteria group bacterium]
MTKRHAIVCGDYINAWTLQQGLRSLNYRSTILPRSKYNAIDQALLAASTLFFTDEAGWARAAQIEVPAHFLPRTYNPIFVDKLLLACHLCAIGETPVPFASFSSDLQNRISPPLVLKPRRSWVGSRKLPRGMVCLSTEQMSQAIRVLQSHGINPDLLLVQQFLTDAENLSVAGFYDFLQPHRSFFIATRKVLGDGGNLSTGVLVETVPAPKGLGKRVQHVLNTLDYRGPFEMEFLRDSRTGQYYILELNPRFWMQHGLFLAGYENCLIRAYLDDQFTIPTATDEELMLPYRPMLWIDRIFLFFALMSNRQTLYRSYQEEVRKARQRGCVVYGFPTWGRAVRFIIGRTVRFLFRSR